MVYTYPAPLQWADKGLCNSLTGSTYSDSLVDPMAYQAEQEIIGALDMNQLPTDPANTQDSGVGMLITAANMWLCRNIKRQMKDDGTLPNHLSVGPITTDVSIDKTISDYDQKGRDALTQYIQSQLGTDTNEDDEVPYGGLLGFAGEEL